MLDLLANASELVFENSTQCAHSLAPPRAYDATFSDSEGKCPSWFGLVRGPAYRMRRPLVDLCMPNTSGNVTNATRRSSVRCVPNNIAKSTDMLLCELENVQLGQAEKFDPVIGTVRPALYAACDWVRSSLSSTAAPDRPWDSSSGSVHFRSLKPLVMRQCDGCEMHPVDGRLTVLGFNSLYNSIRVNETAQHACAWDSRLIEHPVVLVLRRDAFNPFHGHETILSVWSTFLAFGLDPCSTGLLFTDIWDDRAPRAPILELLRRIFAPVHGVERAMALSAAVNPTCYQRLLVSVDPRDNFDIPYYQADKIKGPSTTCGSSPWLQAYARFALAGLGLAPASQPSRLLPHVTLMARQPYRREAHAGLFPTMRIMLNRRQFADGIAELCASERTRTASTKHGGEAVDGERRRCTHSLGVDMAALSILEQVALASGTDVLVGTHGAPFAFMIYMPSHAHVLEVKTATDFHYSNLASYLGISYVPLASSGSHPSTLSFMKGKGAVQGGPRLKRAGIQHKVASFSIDVPSSIESVDAAVKRASVSLSRAMRWSGSSHEPRPSAPLWPRDVVWPPPGANASWTAPRRSRHVDPRPPRPVPPSKTADNRLNPCVWLANKKGRDCRVAPMGFTTRMNHSQRASLVMRRANSIKRGFSGTVYRSRGPESLAHRNRQEQPLVAQLHRRSMT